METLLFVAWYATFVDLHGSIPVTVVGSGVGFGNCLIFVGGLIHSLCYPTGSNVKYLPVKKYQAMSSASKPATMIPYHDCDSENPPR